MTDGTLRTASDFVDAGLIALSDAPEVDRILPRYSAAMSRDLVALVDPTDPADPIARQFVPSANERATHPAERRDPIGDDAFSPTPGLVHRYADRVLLKVVAACPVYCRFCFRRETVGTGKGGVLAEEKLSAALDYIAANNEVAEVILTGGDPLVLSARRLGDILRRIAAIAHVRTIRIHSRVPLVTPAAVDAPLLEALRSAGKAVFIAVHGNHAREFSPDARAACGRLVDAGIPLLGQSVLLAGVNDDVEALVALMRAFVETRITPYYLHHPDLAPGTGHFRVAVARGRALAQALEARLPGFAQPRYVLDLPGGHGKVSLLAARQDADGAWMLRDRHGHLHRYQDALPQTEDDGASDEVAKKPY